MNTNVMTDSPNEAMSIYLALFGWEIDVILNEYKDYMPEWSPLDRVEFALMDIIHQWIYAKGGRP